MERQTLQQQVPVYHVCQQCNGAGCAACADLCIVEGDIYPDGPPCDSCPKPCSVGDECRYVRSLLPITPFIGIKAKPRFFGAGALDDRSLAQIAHDDMVMRGDFEV